MCQVNIFRYLRFVTVGGATCLGFAWAQVLAPMGYTGALVTPTADVMAPNTIQLSYTNDNPERPSRFPGEPYGSVNLGIGLLPGLEVVGRVAFDGDLQCNLFKPQGECPAGLRDHSFGLKYQLPYAFSGGTRIAVGVTDFGGAATNFRSIYGVATSEMGSWDVSLGYGRRGSPDALLSGLFGSARLHITERLQGVGEFGQNNHRAGLVLNQPLSERWSAQLAWSRYFNARSGFKTNAVSVGLTYAADGHVRTGRPSRRGSAVAGGARRALPTSQELAANASLPVRERAEALARRVRAQGLRAVTVRYRDETQADGRSIGIWQVDFDSAAGHELADALGALWMAWLQSTGPADQRLAANVSYLGQMYYRLETDRRCAESVVQGYVDCQPGQSPRARLTTDVPEEGGWEVVYSDGDELRGRPQVELGLDVRAKAATELGLADYSLALDVAASVPFGNGWFWQGYATVPAIQSDDFRAGGQFWLLGHPKTRMDQALLSYVRPIAIGETTVLTQWSAGAITAFARGGQVDAVWWSEDGRWRWGLTAGSYRSSSRNLTSRPALLKAKYELRPGHWSVEAMAGQFLGGDTGWMLRSQHWMGNVGVALFAHRSQTDRLAARPKSFIGVEFSIPLGSGTVTDSQSLGRVDARVKNRVEWGLSTKVGEADNAITRGYGEVPLPRYGVWTDMLDYDRVTVPAWLARRKTIMDNAMP